jgi:hypothetical protein
MNSVSDRRSSAALVCLLRRNSWFVTAVLVGAMVRLLVQVTFPPAFIYSDGPTYLALAHALRPSMDRTVGYSVLLRVLSFATRDVWLVAVVQHLLGLVTAVVMYGLLRRWQVSPLAATLATLPALFDTMELVLEHSVMSDVPFDLLLLLGIGALAWRRRPSYVLVAAGGVLLGLAVLVRVIGEPVIVAAVAYCVGAGPGTGLRGRVLRCAVALVAFAVPVAGYAAWYHSWARTWALDQAGGRALYMRATSFVDCSKIEVPAYERRLCPPEPLGQRQDPTFYGWHDSTTVPALVLPGGVTRDQALHDFGVAAIRAQPWAYAGVVARDIAMNFAPARLDFYEYNSAHKWSFHYYVDYQPTNPATRPAYATYGGQQPQSLQPLADVFTVYGFTVFLSGTLMLALLVVALAGLVAGRRGAPPTRPLTFLTTATALLLMIAPAVTAEFTWRYQLAAVILLPMGAALGWTRLSPEGRLPTT